VADWSDVEISSTTPVSRRAPDFLLLLSDFLFLWDLTACVAAGEIALKWCGQYVQARQMDLSMSGPFWHDIIFGSVIAALMLREPSRLKHQLPAPLPGRMMMAQRRCLAAFGLLVGIGFATRSTDGVARSWIIGWLALFALSVAASRHVVAWYLRRLHRGGVLREAVAIIGAGGARDALARRISDEVRVVGMFDAGAVDQQDDQSEDSLARVLDLGRDGALDSVILAVGPNQETDLGQLIERFRALPVQVAVCPDQSWANATAPQMRMLGGLPMAVVADLPIKRWDLLVKTFIDKVGALVLLIACLPLLLGIAVAVGMSSPGPIIFRQRRKGWYARDFVVFKFRTMYAQSEGPAMQTQRGDVRCTPVGRFLRSLSLDELPQLWNVLVGDMSLVGPRPHADCLHNIDRAGNEIVAEYALRHRMKPGITGWAQIHGARGATATMDQLRRRVQYDLYYIENWSLRLDLQILARTPFCMAGVNAF
jgi:Undecaprenyl-phosphate glucose phosphotransferase